MKNLKIDMIPENYKNTNLEDLPNEIWVDVYGFDGSYEVSNLGRIKSIGRYVDNGRGGQMFVKERILKQCYTGLKKRRVLVNLSLNNKHGTEEVNTVVYYSFFPNKLTDNDGKEVCHLNKNGLDNSLSNLSLISISKSKKIGFNYGVIDAFIDSNKKRKLEYDLQVDRICTCCNKTKLIKYFKRGYHKCTRCEYLSKLKKRGKKYLPKYEIEIIDVVTGEKTLSNNKKKCIVSNQIIKKFANTGNEVIPYKTSKHKNALLIFYKETS